MSAYARMIVHLCVHDCVFAEYPCVHMDVCTWECVRLRAHIQFKLTRVFLLSKASWCMPIPTFQVALSLFS